MLAYLLLDNVDIYFIKGNRCMRIIYWVAALLCFMSYSASADTIVMVHGYLASSKEWRTARVTQPLVQNAWVDGGNYGYHNNTIIQPNEMVKSRAKHVFYTVDLPSGKAIEQQMVLLSHYLHDIYKRRREPLVLVGHSAGGIVSRAYLVQKEGTVPIKALVSIASPHLGTPLAELGVAVANSPLQEAMSLLNLGKVRDMMLGHTPVLYDLREESVKGYLYELNGKSHPDIFYISIIRHNRDSTQMDHVVPQASQNMNNVWALEGRSIEVESDGGHYLGLQDGEILLNIMNWFAMQQ